ncbi:MAG: 1-acyl-sn-glycerol-3-phosphate acyltransferase [Phenylobacterium sp.]|jgi:1-acyl-sn-glycerol-3-phosphate acyltransferase
MDKQALEIRDKTIFDGFLVKFVLKYLFMLWFKVTGWRPTESVPDGAGITIAAPHTSNWDFFYALGAAILVDVKIYFSIKDSWCRKPGIGRFMMWLGAIPIDRSGNGKGQVEQIQNFVKKHKNSRVFFLFTPEGTRSKVEKWKTGFYHVAEGCGLPIFLAKVDYLNKCSGVFHSYQPTGDKIEDVSAIQASYKRVFGKFAKKQFPAYDGPLPEISDAEAAVMRVMYTFKGVATKMDIAAKAKLSGMSGLSTVMLDFLIEKGVLEQVGTRGPGHNEPTYRLTFAGKGCLLHLYPTLPRALSTKV